MKQVVEVLEVATRGRAFHEVTADVDSAIQKFALRTGLVTLHLQHTSASLVIQENADPEVRRDLERFFSRLVPDGDPMFRHASEGDDDMPAHLRTVLTAVSLSVPIVEGRLALGTWQGIYLWEHRAQGHRRRIVMHVVGE